MNGFKKIISGIVTTIIIGGSAYTISQTDVINNFSNDTGMTKQQAEEYVNSIDKDSLVSWEKLGTDLINDSKVILNNVNQIDCINYKYDWESKSLSCQKGKLQLITIANNESSLGNSYIKLGSDNASKEDIKTTIQYIDNLNQSYSLEIVSKLLDDKTITDTKNTNSYNKSTLQAALQSN